MLNVLFTIMVFSTTLCAAIPFKITVSNRTVTAYSCDELKISVHVIADSGFTAPVFVSVNQNVFNEVVDLSATAVNAPYTDSVVITLRPAATDVGSHYVEVIGQNNTAKDVLRVDLNIKPRAQYQKICALPKSFRTRFVSNPFGTKVFKCDSSYCFFNAQGIVTTILDNAMTEVYSITRTGIVEADNQTQQLLRCDGAFWSIINKPSFVGKLVSKLWTDRSNRLYVYSDGPSFAVLDDTTWISYPWTGASRYLIAIDSSGGLWGMEGASLYYSRDGQVCDTMRLPDPVAQGTQRVLHCDRFGRVWIAYIKGFVGTPTNATMLACYSRDGRWKIFDVMQNGTYAYPLNVMVQPDGVIWFTTRMGYCQCPQETASILEIRGDLVMNHMESLCSVLPQHEADAVVDDINQLWITEYVTSYNLGLYTSQHYSGRRMPITEFTTSVPTEPKVFEVRISPQPCNELLQLQCPPAMLNQLVQLYNPAGQRVYADNCMSENMTVPTSNIPSGVYALRIGTYLQTIVIQHEQK